MAGGGSKGGSGKRQPIPTKAPPQADDQLPLVEEDDGSSEEEFDKDYSEGEFDKDLDYEEEDENGYSVDEEKDDENGDEDDGAEGKGANEQEELPLLPDGYYLVETIKKKRVRQVWLSFNYTFFF